MKTGARVALGIATGYLLGRTKKMRLALMIAAAGATGRSGTSPAKLVQSGLKQLGSAPELGKLTEVAREELLGAVKAAAVTALSGRIESLNERLQEGGRKRREEPEDKQREDADDEAEGNGGSREEYEEPEPADDTEPPARRRTASKRDSSSDKRAGSRSRTTTGRTPVRRAGR